MGYVVVTEKSSLSLTGSSIYQLSIQLEADDLLRGDVGIAAANVSLEGNP